MKTGSLSKKKIEGVQAQNVTWEIFSTFERSQIEMSAVVVVLIRHLFQYVTVLQVTGQCYTETTHSTDPWRHSSKCSFRNSFPHAFMTVTLFKNCAFTFPSKIIRDTACSL
jgi:ABC-type transport system involved in Fe-S cluster assembly fused permease/ATPase subunit